MGEICARDCGLKARQSAVPFKGQCDISAEQWSPMAVVGDAHVTEMLTPLVNLTTALLTPHFLQVAVQIQDPHPECSKHEPLTSSYMFSQQAGTKHIHAVIATRCHKSL